MPLQKYDIPDPVGGGMVERWWSLISVPVVGPDGEVELIAQRAEDVTDWVTERESSAELGRRVQEVGADGERRFDWDDRGYLRSVTTLTHAHDKVTARTHRLRTDALGEPADVDGAPVASSLPVAITPRWHRRPRGAPRRGRIAYHPRRVPG